MFIACAIGQCLCFIFGLRMRKNEMRAASGPTGWASSSTGYYGDSSYRPSFPARSHQHREKVEESQRKRLPPLANWRINREKSRRGNFPILRLRYIPSHLNSVYRWELQLTPAGLMLHNQTFKNPIFIALGFWAWVDRKKLGYYRTVWNREKSAAYSANFTF